MRTGNAVSDRAVTVGACPYSCDPAYGTAVVHAEPRGDDLWPPPTRTRHRQHPRPAPAGRPVLSRASSRVIWLLLGAAFVAILNETTMGVAIPHLIADLGITALAAAVADDGVHADDGRRHPDHRASCCSGSRRAPMFVAAMRLFSPGTLIAFLAPGFPMLLVARVVQASGTAIMMPLLMTTIMTVVPPQSRGRMMGRVSVVISLAPAIGPTLSGLLLDTVGWRWIFADRAADRPRRPRRRRALDPQPRRDHARRPIDVLSVILSALGFGGIVFGLSQIGGAAAHTARRGRGGRGRRVDGRAHRLALGRRRRARRCSSGASCVCSEGRRRAARPAGLPLGELLALDRARWRSCRSRSSAPSPSSRSTCRTCSRSRRSQTGLVVLPGALAMGLTGPFIGRIYDRWGTRVLLVPGSIIASALLWFYTTFDETTPVWISRGRADRAVARPGDVVHAAVHGVARVAAAAVLLVRLRGRRHRAAGRRRRRHRPDDRGHARPSRRMRVAGGASEVAASAAGAHAAFLDRRDRVAAADRRRVPHPQAGRSAVGAPAAH